MRTPSYPRLTTERGRLQLILHKIIIIFVIPNTFCFLLFLYLLIPYAFYSRETGMKAEFKSRQIVQRAAWSINGRSLLD
jgi:hypothetical protein